MRKINQNELMSKKHKTVCRLLNHIECLLILISTATGCVSISAFSSFSIPIGITSSAVGLKTCAVTAGTKKYKSIARKKEET